MYVCSYTQGYNLDIWSSYDVNKYPHTGLYSYIALLNQKGIPAVNNKSVE